MPKLLILAPCDNVLYSGQTGSVSLVVIFTEIRFPKIDPFPPDGALAPMRWFFFTQWEVFPEDVGHSFEQKLTVTDGDKELNNMVAPMEIPGPILHLRTITPSNAFPILQPGIYRMEVRFRKVGDEAWMLAGSYPLNIVHGEQIEN